MSIDWTKKVSIEDKFAKAKEAKNIEISQAFASYVTGSFTCSLGYPMQFDKNDSLLMEGAIQLMQASGATEGYLTDAENVSHYNVPLADIQTVKLEMLAEYAMAHLKKQTLRTQIDSATTQAELDAIIY